jgi:hypothetical protein
LEVTVLVHFVLSIDLASGSPKGALCHGEATYVVMLPVVHPTAAEVILPLKYVNRRPLGVKAVACKVI